MSMTNVAKRLRRLHADWSLAGKGPDIFIEAADEHDRLSRQLAEARAELALWRASFPGSAEAVKRDAHAAAKRTIYDRCEKCGTIYRPGERHACAQQPDMQTTDKP
jgi:hypothetical protein